MVIFETIISYFSLAHFIAEVASENFFLNFISYLGLFPDLKSFFGPGFNFKLSDLFLQRMLHKELLLLENWQLFPNMILISFVLLKLFKKSFASFFINF